MKLFPGATISAVIVVEDAAPEGFFLSLLDILHGHFGSLEIVVVANGVDAATLGALKEVVAKLPDTTAHLLLNRVEPEAARLFGLDNALSDWVLMIDPAEDQLKHVSAMIQRSAEGYDGVIVDSGWKPRRDLYNFLANRFIRVSRSMTGVAVERSFAPLRLMNRALALRIVNDPYGELLVRASDVAGGFRIARIKGDYAATALEGRKRVGGGFRKGLSALARSSVLPLRIVSIGSFAVGLLSVLYTGYVVLIYLFKPDVMPGWTTISLQISGLMVLVSVMFWMIAEYIVAIRAALPPRRRIAVARELRSERTLSSGLINVVDEEGRAFRLGRNAPSSDAA